MNSSKFQPSRGRSIIWTNIFLTCVLSWAPLSAVQALEPRPSSIASPLVLSISSRNIITLDNGTIINNNATLSNGTALTNGTVLGNSTLPINGTTLTNTTLPSNTTSLTNTTLPSNTTSLTNTTAHLNTTTTLTALTRRATTSATIYIPTPTPPTPPLSPAIIAILSFSAIMGTALFLSYLSCLCARHRARKTANHSESETRNGMTISWPVRSEKLSEPEMSATPRIQTVKFSEKKQYQPPASDHERDRFLLGVGQMPITRDRQESTWPFTGREIPASRDGPRMMEGSGMPMPPYPGPWHPPMPPAHTERPYTTRIPQGAIGAVYRDRDRDEREGRGFDQGTQKYRAEVMVNRF